MSMLRQSQSLALLRSPWEVRLETILQFLMPPLSWAVGSQAQILWLHRNLLLHLNVSSDLDP